MNALGTLAVNINPLLPVKQCGFIQQTQPISTVHDDLMLRLLRIDTPQGRIIHAVYDTMQFIKNDIATICLGQAASAAAVLLAAGTKGKRLALPHARILLHQPYGQVGYGQVTDLEIAAKEILRMRDLLEQIVAKHTGQTIERVHADTDRDFVMEAEEAKAYGVIDEVISVRSAVDRSGPIR